MTRRRIPSSWPGTCWSKKLPRWSGNRTARRGRRTSPRTTTGCNGVRLCRGPAARPRRGRPPVVDHQVGRLRELLTDNEAIEAAEDPDWADRAALDCSPEFERAPVVPSARTRELLRTLDTLCKLRKCGVGACGELKKNSECGMANSECGIGNWSAEWEFGMRNGG